MSRSITPSIPAGTAWLPRTMCQPRSSPRSRPRRRGPDTGSRKRTSTAGSGKLRVSGHAAARDPLQIRRLDLYCHVVAAAAAEDRVQACHVLVDEDDRSFDREWHDAAELHAQLRLDIDGIRGSKVGTAHAEGVGDLLVIGAVGAAQRHDREGAAWDAKDEAFHHGAGIEGQDP